MLAAGRTWAEIIRETGETKARLRYAIFPGEKVKALARGRNKRECRSTEARFVTRRPARILRGPKAGEPDPSLRAATSAFARGEIDRAELMRRIGGRA